MIDKTIRVNVDSKEAEKNLSNVKTGLDETGDAAKTSQAEISTLTGSAGARFSGLIKSIKSVALGFKSLKFAIAASGIGLVLIAIVAISAAFKGSEDGQNKFAKLMGVIGSITGNLMDVLADLGDFIINLFSGDGAAMTQLKNFGKSIFNVIGLPIKNAIDVVKTLGNVLGALFSRDISGAFDALKQGVEDIKGNFTEAKDEIVAAKNALKDFGDQIIEEGNAAAKVADQRAQADKIERGLIVDRANSEREIAKLRLKAKDLNNVSAKDREEALLTVLSIQDDLIKRETEVLQLRRDAIIAENGFARSNKENLDAEENAKAAVIAAETKRIDQQRTIQRELTAAENEQRSARNAAAKEYQTKRDAEAKAEMERLKSISDFRDELIKKDEDNDAKNLEEKLELERLRAEEKLELLIGDEEEKREALIALNEFYDQKELELQEQRDAEKKAKDEKDLSDAQKKADEEAKIAARLAKEEKQYKKDLKDATIGLARNTIALLGGIAEEGSALAKGVAVAQAIMNTYQGITSALAQSVDPTPGQGIRLANAAIVGVAGFLNVANILKTKPIEKSVPGGLGAGGGDAPRAPRFDLVEGTESNQINESIQNNNEPIRAVVVSGDVTTAQSIDRNIVEGSGI